jgi:UDP:flavonoid glycosyltransferase YjiC (YdhE family)
MYAAAPPLVERVTSVLVDEGFDVLLTAPEAPPGTHTSRVRVEPFVSLPAVLPRCSLVVCHGGAGTTLAALASGLPVLLLPRGAPSQARMAEACRRAGAAEVVEEGDDGRAALVAAVRRLATDPRYQAAARSIAAEIAAMPAAPSVVPALEALAGRA